MSKVIFVSIDGNIGCGKSTLLDILKEELTNVTIIDEPVCQWNTLVNESNKNLLELFYEDKKRWSYTFQNYALFTRLNIVKETLEQVEKKEGVHIVISERSILTDKYVFADMLRESEYITKLEWELYCIWFDKLSKNYSVSAIIHINTSPEISYQRIQQRNRLGENNISFDYIQQLDIQHTNWLSSIDIPVLTISTGICSSEVEETLQVSNNIIKIKEFLVRLSS
jgi:deoxyadenosine/deoxycytidine kinase